MPPSSHAALLLLLLPPRCGGFFFGAQRVAPPAATRSPRSSPAMVASSQYRGDSSAAAEGGGFVLDNMSMDAAAAAMSDMQRDGELPPRRPLKVMVAGGGIGGLCAALVLKNAGCEVAVYEKAREYRPFGGPIQIATNALESLVRIDQGVYDEIIAASTKIGDRMNGLKDGISNEWFATFDLLSPAKARAAEASIVIDRPILQDILLSRVGECVTVGQEVVAYEQQSSSSSGVVGILADGSRVEADLLIGSDGIRSKVREQLVDSKEPQWSGYTCFAAIANVVPDDIKDVGYKVFLGSRKYFVSVDVGGGRIQWYAFLNIPPRSLSLEPAEMCSWLKETQFADWSPEVHQLLDNTPVDQVEQRDLYDRAPELKWVQGRVALLGDAAHPMMPNLGQGGGMAIEDALVLGQELRRMDTLEAVPEALGQYNKNRALRAAAVQGMSRASSAILFQYNHPTTLEWGEDGGMPRLKNFGPRSLITRACQGFLQKVAFPMQFEFLFSFPRKTLDPKVFNTPYGLGDAERDLLVGGKKGMTMKDWFERYW